MQSYGFVGTGEITAAIVEGLSADVPAPPAVFLSPRNHDVAHDLAARFPNVRVCAATRTCSTARARSSSPCARRSSRKCWRNSTFRPEHVVVSAVAGVPLDRLAGWVAPATRIVRSIPLPTTSRRAGRTAMYPDDAGARALFESVGDVVVPADETTLATFSAATATFAAHLGQLAAIAGWMAGHGVDPEDADAYIAHVYGELGRTLARHDGTLEELAAKHMTPGGINEQFRATMRDIPTSAASTRSSPASRSVADGALQQRRVHGGRLPVDRRARELQHRPQRPVHRGRVVQGRRRDLVQRARGARRRTSRPGRRGCPRGAPPAGRRGSARPCPGGRAARPAPPPPDVVPSSSATAATASMTVNSVVGRGRRRRPRGRSRRPAASRRYLPERKPFFSGLHGTSAMPWSTGERRELALDRPGQQRVLDLQRDQRRPAPAAAPSSGPAR